MSFADKTITCRDCGTPFVFTAGEQEFYASKGFINEPTRCPTCRQARKTNKSGGGFAPRERSARPASFDGAPRERVAHQVTCANCGQETTVPFIPRGTKPVYCADCFAQMRDAPRAPRY